MNHQKQCIDTERFETNKSRPNPGLTKLLVAILSWLGFVSEDKEGMSTSYAGLLVVVQPDTRTPDPGKLPQASGAASRWAFLPHLLSFSETLLSSSKLVIASEMVEHQAQRSAASKYGLTEVDGCI